MSKRWNLEDDDFLARFYDAVGDYVGTHDLGRRKGAADERVKKLKATGAWDALKKRQRDDYTNLRTYFQAVGTPTDVETLDMMHPGAPDDSDLQGKLKPAMKLDVYRFNQMRDPD